MNVKYAGPFLDYSGYGQASRHHIAALETAGVGVVGELLTYSSENADYGKLGSLMQEVKDRKAEYKIKLLHATPDEYPRLYQPGKYHIGFVYWETDQIPQSFAEGLKVCDEVWTGSQANFDAIRKAGVSKPIKIFPQAMEVDIEFPEPYIIPNFEGYLFYSVFEWTDRKNPTALLEAYLKEFKHGDHVGLLIKTYFRNFSYVNKKMIKAAIEKARNLTGVTAEEVPIFLYLDLMDQQQVLRLHATGDCLVLPHRGEGWGLPQVEASLAGNPIITTGYSGVNEYFDDTNSYKLSYKMKPLKGMLHSQRFYNEGQNWADVQIEELQKTMREAYKNREESEKKGRLAQQFVKERFNLKRVGSEMADRLAEIEATL